MLLVVLHSSGRQVVEVRSVGVGYVGGETAVISTAGHALVEVGTRVAAASAPVGSGAALAASGAGEEAVAGALERCGAAWARLLGDTARQVEALGRLADAGGRDLARAGGEAAS